MIVAFLVVCSVTVGIALFTKLILGKNDNNPDPWDHFNNFKS